MVDSTVMQTGRYKAYPEYKDSGVEWLGEIPKDWSVLSLKYVLKLISNGATTTQIDESPKTVPISRIETISTGEINMSKVGHINPKSISKSFKLELGDILFSHINSLSMVGNIAIKKDTKMLYHGMNLLRLRVDEVNFDRNYIYWLLKSRNLRQVFESNAKPAINQASLSTNSIKSIDICIGNKKEQQKIANFLDHETAKIDTLIEKQQRLIELLTEKRQAVISHAVTKGLNPDAPMKDSGVEWLGKVPEHWEVTRIKHVVNNFEQGWSPQCDSRPADKDEYGVLKVGAVNYSEFRPEENKALPPELIPRMQYQIKKDDLLISRANTKELVGSAAVVGKDYPQLLLCDKLYRLKLNTNASPSLIALYLSIAPVRGQIELQASGASHSMQNISQDVIKELPCLIPPLEEAKKLVEKINAKLEVFNQMTIKAQQAIQLMQERRTALISAAVTGKIDVRDWVKPS